MELLIPLVDVELVSQVPIEFTTHLEMVVNILRNSFSAKGIEPPDAGIVEMINPKMEKECIYAIWNLVLQERNIERKMMLSLHLSQLKNIHCMISTQYDGWCQELKMCLPRHLGKPVIGMRVQPSIAFNDGVMKKFHASLGRKVACVRSITHLMNPCLLKKYEKRKMEMEMAGGGGVREDWLFHGTSVANVGSICARGFWLPQHKHCLGQYCFCDDKQELELVPGGPWTADSRDRTSSSASHPRMANQLDPNALLQTTSSYAGCRHYMFLCRVLLGDSAPAKSWYEKPPLKGYSYKRYDSCYGSDSQHMDQWAVFDKSQAYPEYIIEYEKFHHQV